MWPRSRKNRAVVSLSETNPTERTAPMSIEVFTRPYAFRWVARASWKVLPAVQCACPMFPVIAVPKDSMIKKLRLVFDNVQCRFKLPWTLGAVTDSMLYLSGAGMESRHVLVT